MSRQEDAQSAAIPVNAILITGYLAMFVFLGDPSHAAARLLAPVPFTAPLLQPMRIAAGEAPPLEVGLAVLLTGLTVVALAKLSGHIYSQLALHRGGRVRWLQALRPGR